MLSHADSNHAETTVDITALVQIHLIRSATPSTLRAIRETARIARYGAGDYVYRQGQYSGRFYLVLAGEAELLAESEESIPVIIGRIGPGGHFGETAILSNTPHQLSSRALVELTLLLVSEHCFKKTLLEDKAVLKQLCCSQATRLRLAFTDRALAAPPSSSRKPVPALKKHAPVQDRLPSRFQTIAHRSGTQNDKKQQSQIETAASTAAPMLLAGEMGTGRRELAYAIHCRRYGAKAPYYEIDLSGEQANRPEAQLFGYDHESPLFSPAHNLGLLDKATGGTLVISGIEHCSQELQHHLWSVLEGGEFRRMGSKTARPLACKLILIVTDSPNAKDGPVHLLPGLYRFLEPSQLDLAPLRHRKKEIPQLLRHYLKIYSLQYKKEIREFDKHTLGMIINYDWPGNLEELASVVQRAVILGRHDQPLDSSILPGVPKPEGTWEYNLLRLPLVRSFFNHALFPVLPRIVVGIFLFLTLATLLLGPRTQHENLGLLLSWEVGWPLLIFCFFFFARLWCSICGLAVPGWLAQRVIKPKRPTPALIRDYSGWLVALFCIALFWVEMAWDSYGSPLLTAGILISIILGSLLFSALFERRVWCRYLCPLGGLNALFSMSSIIELRANSHLCLSQCRDHNCYTGDIKAPGCPMFRHPFSVDNNRDCILCGNCSKNCGHQAIQLNLRLAPRELWNQRQPRLADTLLICALTAIIPLFILRPQLRLYLESFGSSIAPSLLFSLVYFGAILLSLSIYALFSGIIATITQRPWRLAAAALSYGLIPLALATLLAAHIELFMSSFHHIPAAVCGYLGVEMNFSASRLLSRDGTIVLQAIAVLGGLAASLPACWQIINRLSAPGGRALTAQLFTSLLLGHLACWYLIILL